MQFREVCRVMDAFESCGIRFWLAGGWGVAALVGAQTRAHRDLDLIVDHTGLDRCLESALQLGYRRETDWLPVRVELVAPGRGWIDIHPVAFDAHGHGLQAGLGGAHFDYPPDAFTTGHIEDRSVPCLSAAQQRTFHAGYVPRPQDVHDLEQLSRLDD